MLGFWNAVDLEDGDQNKQVDVTEKMLTRATEIATEDPTLPPRKIYELILKEIKGQHRFFKGASDQKIINKVRNSRTYLNGSDVFRTIETNTVAKVRNTNPFFLQFNATFPNDCDGKLECMIGFGNPPLFRTLRGCKRMFIDGTFKFVPKPFYQCLIIMIFDDQTDAYVPVFYILLTSKTKQIYIQALRWVQISVDQQINPVSVTCDFEIALQKAIVSTFPSAVINRCFFHWKQAIRQKILDLNFSENVCKRMMWKDTLEVFTIINPTNIKWKGIPYIRSIVDDGLSQDDMLKMKKFWKYFENFWLKIRASSLHGMFFGHYKNKKIKLLQRTNNGL